MLRHLSMGAFIAAGALAIGGLTLSAQAPPFNFDTGNAAIEVIIPAVIPALFQTTAPNDAPIILRHTAVITNAWFDAIAPYHPTSSGSTPASAAGAPVEATNEQTEEHRAVLCLVSGAEQHDAQVCGQLARDAYLSGASIRTTRAKT